MPKADLDKTDIGILAALQKNGRLSNVELAETVALSPSPCLRRLKLLEDNGIIQGYVARLSPQALGLDIHAFVRLQVDRHRPEAVQALLDAVASWPEVTGCFSLAGDTECLLDIRASDMAHYARFVQEQLLAQPAVLSARSSFVLRTWKDSTELPLDALSASGD
ncbi:Lrp/AsnC family transcriptional regulator [Amphibiibacter pelophylacis]|uniref:Lrp/AsnC family transcriptional regulator n=1 Tax=Amphibiibacter pelophylacis TaxID=1799477 RepID=A0ACC6P083_9BURK